jgi:hypothetical protein
MKTGAKVKTTWNGDAQLQAIGKGIERGLKRAGLALQGASQKTPARTMKPQLFKIIKESAKI